MKSNAKSPLYFSAYPLKAIKETSASAAPAQTPYLRSILAGKSKSSSRVRVFAMVNPYTELKTFRKPVQRAKDVPAAGQEWYNNYE